MRGDVEHGQPIEEQDWFLTSLVSIVNKLEVQPSITLFVGGMMVSGQLMSDKRYFEELGRRWDAALGEQIGESPTEEFAGPFKDGAATPEPPSYIHLQGARMSIPGVRSSRSSEPIYWRGLLRAVDGFFMGELTDEP